MLITLEGIDGSGKSTQARKLYENLKKLGYDVSLYRDPGSTEVAEKLREILLNFELHPITELLLFEGARSSLVREKILPDLEKGKIVIVDRYIDSTVAYQGYGKNIDLQVVNLLNHIATEGKNPHITFLIDIPVDLALSRIKNKTRFEAKDYLERIREAYLLIANKERDRIVVIDGTRDEHIVQGEILDHLKRKFGIGFSP